MNRVKACLDARLAQVEAAEQPVLEATVAEIAINRNVLRKPQTPAARYTTKNNRGDRQSVTSRKEPEWSYNGIAI